MRLNMKEFLKAELFASNDTLKEAVIEYFLAHNEDDSDLLNHLNNVMDNGASSAGIMTSTHDIISFYDKYKGSLIERIESEYNSLNEYLYNYIQNNDISDLNEIKTDIVYFGFEEIVRDLLTVYNL